MLLVGAATAAFAKVEALRPLDAFYFAVATVSTVGYGDVVPRTDAGKALAIPLLLLGSSLVASALGSLAALPFEARRAAQQRFVLAQLGDELDRDELVYIAGRADELTGGGTGAVDRSSFALALLVRQDKVRAADVRRVLETFDRLDADGSGVLDGDDLRGFFAETAAPELLEALQQRPAAELFARMSRSGVVRFDDLRRFDGFADVGDASLRRFISVGDDSGDGALDAGEFAATVDAIAARADVGD